MSHPNRTRSVAGPITAVILTVAVVFVSPTLGDEAMPRRHGYRAGLTLSDWRGFSAEGKDIGRAPGAVLGAYWSFPVNEDIIFQPELALNLKRINLKYDYNVGAGSLSFDETATLYYIEMPLLVRMPFRMNDKSAWSVFAGPVWALSLGGRRSGSFTSSVGQVPSDNFSGSIGNTERLDICVAVGWSVHWGSGNKRHTVDLRYVMGLKSAFADMDDPTTVTDSKLPFFNPISGRADQYKNGTFTLSLGWDTPW